MLSAAKQTVALGGTPSGTIFVRALHKGRPWHTLAVDVRERIEDPLPVFHSKRFQMVRGWSSQEQ